MAINVDAVQQLLERDRELEIAGAALARAAQRAGGVLLIEGPPGVGKSQLMAAIRAIARKSGLTVLEARGAALEREFAFGVVRQLFEQVTMPGRVDNPEALFAGAASMATSVLATIEAKWNLPALTYRDANAATVMDFLDPGQATFTSPPVIKGPRQ